MLSRILPFAAAMVIAAPASLAADLRPRFVGGSTLKYQVITDLARTQSAPELGIPSQSQRTSVVIDATRRIVSVDEATGGAAAEVVFTRYVLRSDNPATPPFDSSRPVDQDAKDDPRAAVIRAMLDKPIALTVDRFGAITDVRTPEGFALGRTGPDGLKKQLAALFQIRAEPGTAEPGSSWTVSETAPSPMVGAAVKSDMTFHLESVEGENAVIRVSGALSLPEPGEGQPKALMSITGSSSSGTVRWNVGTGTLEEFAVTQSTKLRREVEGGKFIELTDESTNIVRMVK
ncbi:MAG: hypothetical protein IBJ11_02570 [Phycisphaerales bacterium]|nr:hypothetical protein [Phycisphaerales bacterium]